MSNNTTIGSLTLGIQILDVVAMSDTPLKFSDIQELTGISKSNLYKYLNTLIQVGLLYREQKRGYYALGYKMLEYGTAAMQNADFIGRLTPFFKEISKLTNMTTLLTTWVNDAPVITNIWNVNFGLNIGAQVGTVLPLHSAAGKVFAAYAHCFEMAEWINREQQQTADFDVFAFQREMKQIRAYEFAYAKESLVRHVSSLSFPIRNFKNELVGVCGLVGFEEDVPNEPDSELIIAIKEIIDEMSAIFGYGKKVEEHNTVK